MPANSDPILDAVAEAIAARQAAELAEVQAVADALNAGRTWRQIAARLGKPEAQGNLHTKYMKRLNVDKAARTYAVKDLLSEQERVIVMVTAQDRTAKEPAMNTTAALQLIVNVEAQDDTTGLVRGFIVPAGTDPGADLELEAVAHIDVEATEDEGEWDRHMLDALTGAGYRLGEVSQDGAWLTATVTPA